MAESMLPDVAASAIAADSLSYHGVAQLILEQQLTAPAIARLFSLSASPNAGHVAAVVILAAATARFNTCCENFSGDLERDLVGTETLLAEADRKAVKLVRDHWQEITAGVIRRASLTAPRSSSWSAIPEAGAF
jgi:hypothetical protein